MSVSNEQKNPNYLEQECPYCKCKTIIRLDNELECKSCGEVWVVAGPIEACKSGSCSLRG